MLKQLETYRFCFVTSRYFKEVGLHRAAHLAEQARDGALRVLGHLHALAEHNAPLAARWMQGAAGSGTRRHASGSSTSSTWPFAGRPTLRRR